MDLLKKYILHGNVAKESMSNVHFKIKPKYVYVFFVYRLRDLLCG
jgi:hypothetical protein